MEYPPDVTDNFDALCRICGADVHIRDGVEQLHRCRIDFDRLAGRS